MLVTARFTLQNFQIISKKNAYQQTFGTQSVIWITAAIKCCALSIPYKNYSLNSDKYNHNKVKHPVGGLILNIDDGVFLHLITISQIQNLMSLILNIMCDEKEVPSYYNNKTFYSHRPHWGLTWCFKRKENKQTAALLTSGDYSGIGVLSLMTTWTYVESHSLIFAGNGSLHLSKERTFLYY